MVSVEQHQHKGGYPTARKIRKPAVIAPAPATVNPPEEIAGSIPAEPLAEFTRRDEPDAPAKRLTLPITDLGGVDHTAMRPETVQRLRDAITATPDLFPATGPTVTISIVTAGMAAHLYRLIGSVESSLAQRIWKIPAAQADALFTYTAGDLDVLAEPTAAVANKYLPQDLGKYKEEISLALALIAVHQSKIVALNEYRHRQAQAKLYAVARPPQPEPLVRQTEPAAAHFTNGEDSI